MAHQNASTDCLASNLVTLRAVADLTPDPRNPRKHKKTQIRAIARCIEAFGFNAPVLVDKSGRIICGHGRCQAALLIGLTQIPVICLEHLSEAQARAYAIADNRLTDRSAWDDKALARHLKELTALALDFDIEVTGFEQPKIELRIQSLDITPVDCADQFELASGPTVSRWSDLWVLDNHRLYCASPLDRAAYNTILANETAAAVFTDPSYNRKLHDCASANGKVAPCQSSNAAEATAEIEFTGILDQVSGNLRANCRNGALLYIGVEWPHMGEWLAAGCRAGLDSLDLCIWTKTSGGMGQLYRAGHELIIVFKNGQASQFKSVELGRSRRSRSNVWNHLGVRGSSRGKGRRRNEPQPSAKPIALIADAILDCTQRGETVLDPFVGSGATILAAERTGRCCRGIEPDPRSVDTAITRWQRSMRLQLSAGAVNERGG